MSISDASRSKADESFSSTNFSIAFKSISSLSAMEECILIGSFASSAVNCGIVIYFKLLTNVFWSETGI